MNQVDISQQRIFEKAENNNVSSNLKTRIKKTTSLMFRFASKDEKILDLGPDNVMSRELQKSGYDITQTGYIDLDDNFEMLKGLDQGVVTAFEILEHLRNPYMILKTLQAEKIIISVPLSVWFSKAYWNNNDPWDTHYHEFEPKQIRSLLDKTGWEIIHEEKWWWKSSPLKPRPLLRKYGPWPSWMAIVATRKK